MPHLAMCGKAWRKHQTLLKQNDEKVKKSFSLHFSPLLAPPYVKDPPSAPPPPFFFSLSLCSLALCAFSPPLPSPSMLWYADMQEFLGLKMIDQTCQPWLRLLKMAASAVCVPAIGARLSYSPRDWS